MAYEPLARRYRPQNFDELIGQEALVRALKNTLAQKKIHPAYIFSGIRGIGKTTVARLFAKGLNCEKGITPKPCNECPSCTEITRGYSIDMLEIDGATHTGADEARLLTDMAKYTPARDRFRIFLIDEVHMLSKAAFNALLKTLEEPPPQAVFLFATTEPHKIPETIDSRSYHFRLKRISEEMIYFKLKSIAEKESIDIEDEALKIIARYGDGSMRDSLTILDRLLSYAGLERITESMVTKVLGIVGRDFLLRVAKAILNYDIKTLYNLLDELFSKGDDPERFLSDLLVIFREFLRGKTTGEATEDLIHLLQKISLEDILRSIDILNLSAQRIKGALDQRAVLELELIKIASLPAILPIDTILRGLPENSNILFKNDVEAQPKNKENIKVDEKAIIEEVTSEELNFKSIIPFKRMDDEEAMSFEGLNPLFKKIKNEISEELPLALETIEKSTFSVDPSGNLHISIPSNRETIFKYLTDRQNILAIEKIAKRNGIGGKIFVEKNGTEDFEFEKEEKPVRKKAERKQGTLLLLESFSGEISAIEKKDVESGGEDGELE